ncbi:hypothetical protein VTO42DRAFT_8777 [Malbranchea cinnamomea]
MGAGASTPTASPDPNPPASGVCPVDHKARAAWLAQHQGAAPHPLSPSDSTNPSLPSSSASPNSDSPTPTKLVRQLSNDREISSIPRALPSTSKSQSSVPSTPPSPYAQQQCPAAVSHGTPSNAEAETGHDPKTGNWIYPSERQFFDALVRKGTPTSAQSPNELATSVASIIPIHNAVNERAWSEILAWESKAPTSDPGSKKCGGPKLYSFRGLGVDKRFLSPRARLNGLLGYQLPFDRHDWVVERCDGERIEYVIDFYQGKGGDGSGLTGAAKGKLSFYLDVRPKLNSWEGWRMRVYRFLGL